MPQFNLEHETQRATQRATRDYYEAKDALAREWSEIAKPGMNALEVLEALTRRTPEQHAENERLCRQKEDAADRLLELREAF